MPNEILIILSFLLIYGGVVLFYRLFGKKGLLAFNVMATLLANIEVLLVVRAFGIEMTLGNVLFASTFLITDILSENHGKKTPTGPSSSAHYAPSSSSLYHRCGCFTHLAKATGQAVRSAPYSAAPRAWYALPSSYISSPNSSTYGFTINGGTGAGSVSETRIRVCG